jgi:hypothetical protein
MAALAFEVGQCHVGAMVSSHAQKVKGFYVTATFAHAEQKPTFS